MNRRIGAFGTVFGVYLGRDSIKHVLLPARYADPNIALVKYLPKTVSVHKLFSRD